MAYQNVDISTKYCDQGDSDATCEIAIVECLGDYQVPRARAGA